VNKFERQGAILKLVGERQLSTQSDVVEALRDEGLEAVQATVSRDIAQLGLVKVRGEQGRLVYALPGAADLDRLSELAAALRRWVVALESTGNLVVVRTPPGCANALAQILPAGRWSSGTRRGPLSGIGSSLHHTWPECPRYSLSRRAGYRAR
jgi:transcriptional regulator of arginine metabolism